MSESKPGKGIPGQSKVSVPEATQEELVLAGEQLLEGAELDAEGAEVTELASNLVATYDYVFGRKDLRHRAAQVVGRLAARSSRVLELVIDSAVRYADTQRIDDAFPYSPNGFEVLLQVGRGHERVLSFLRDVIRDDYGIPRWEALRVLCQLDDPAADAIIADVIRGLYPPTKLDHESDLRVIEQNKGRDFIEQHRP